MRKVVICIAVERYTDPRIHSVDHAAADAIEFASALEQHGFEGGDQLILIDGNATKTTIESKVPKWIQGLDAGDLLFLFLAGHGFSQAGGNFIACHDTLHDDLANTSIRVEWLFDQLRSSSCCKVALFLDSCQPGLLAATGTCADFAGDELDQFFQESEHRLCFAACAPGEESRRHASLGHGIWTYHLIRALTGEATIALEKKTLLTSSSLQKFLEDEVPRSVRRLCTGNQTQTPWFYGSASSDFLIADLGSILPQKTTPVDSMQKQLKYVRLLNDEHLSVRKLSGFKKGHFVPDRISDFTVSFVTEIATKDVEEEIDQVFDDLKKVFKLKRRDITVSMDEGSGSIITPYFDFEVTVSLNPEDPSEAILRRQIGNIRQPDQVFSDAFDTVFEGKFDRLEFGSGQTLNIEKIIDQIEDLDSDDIEVNYDKDLTYCSIHVADNDTRIEVTADSFCIAQSGRQSPRALIQSFFDAHSLLMDKHELQVHLFDPATE